MRTASTANGWASGCFSLCLLAALLLPGATDAGATSLEETVGIAVSSNPEVGVVAADREAVGQELRQARAEYFPSLDLRAAAGPEYTNSPATRARNGARTLARLESQLTLSQNLFNGFARRSEVERQLARVDSASYRVQEAAEFIGLDAIEAHLDVLRNQAIVQLAEGNIANHRRILDQVAQLEREGAGGIGDVRQTEARVAAAEGSLAVALGNLHDAEATYQSVVSVPPADLEQPLVPYGEIPPSREDAASRSSFGNPTVLIADAEIETAKAELLGSRSGFYPRLDLELGAAANENIDGIEGGEVDAQALLVLRYNLFRGGGDIAREREAYFRVREAREGLRRARREAEEEARVSYNALKTAQARVESLRSQAEATRATRDAYAQQFDLGQRSLLDLLDAENELFLARTDLVTAEVTEIFAVYRVLAVTGDLLVVLEIDRPKESINIYREREEELHEPLPDQSSAAEPAASSSAAASGGTADDARRTVVPAGAVDRESDSFGSWQGFLDVLGPAR